MPNNVGEIGTESIRLNDMRIGELPIAEGHKAREELPVAIAVEKQSAIDNIKARYPKQNVGYLKGRISEANGNILRMRSTRGEAEKLISEYTTLISMCKYRDKELSLLSHLVFDDEKRKDLKKRFPLYDVAAMERQVEQSKKGIVDCEKVIEQENETIVEFREILVLCEQREREIARIK